MKQYFQNYKGFTLIELLVVISIIGILSSAAVVSLNDARLKARDAKRQADINQIYTALQLYIDNNGVYPECSCDGGYPTADCWVNELTNELLINPEKPYIMPMPIDPKNRDGYFYQYCSDDGDEFLIYYELESSEGTVAVRGF